MIFLACFFPVAVYVLVLGALNRRRHPLLVSGVWDFVGILLAASGFLLFGGPAVLTSLDERWRTFWMLGGGGGSLEALRNFWMILAALYFVVVVAGAGLVFWRQRSLTAIYNADEGTVTEALLRVCERRGTKLVRSGNLFLFGLSADLFPGRRGSDGEGIQAPHYLPGGVQTADKVKLEPAAPASASEPPSVLEVDAFPLMQHVTLRWDPADSPLRREIEAELGRELATTPAPEHDVGAWLITLGLGLLVLLFVAALVLLFLRYYLLA